MSLDNDLTKQWEDDPPEKVVSDRVWMRYFRMALKSDIGKARKIWDRVYREREVRPLCYAVLNSIGRKYLNGAAKDNREKAEKIIELFSGNPYYWNLWKNDFKLNKSKI